MKMQGADEAFKVYLLLGAPSDDKLKPAFNRAVSILQKIPGEKEIIHERDATKLAARLAKEIEQHEAE
jgi:ribosomal protein S20